MFISILQHAFMLTGFVFIMMLAIEYIHVQTRGNWQKKLTKNRWRQYFIGALLGVIPGCLGPFSIVALYAHNSISFGTLTGTMIATSGDEAYVMLSMIPEKALVIFLILFVIGFIVSWIVDKVFRRYQLMQEVPNHELELHEQDYCKCFDKDIILPQLRNLTLQRGPLIGMLFLFLVELIIGHIGWIIRSLPLMKGKQGNGLAARI